MYRNLCPLPPANINHELCCNKSPVMYPGNTLLRRTRYITYSSWFCINDTLLVVNKTLPIIRQAAPPSSTRVPVTSSTISLRNPMICLLEALTNDFPTQPESVQTKNITVNTQHTPTRDHSTTFADSLNNTSLAEANNWDFCEYLT